MLTKMLTYKIGSHPIGGDTAKFFLAIFAHTYTVSSNKFSRHLLNIDRGRFHENELVM